MVPVRRKRAIGARRRNSTARRSVGDEHLLHLIPYLHCGLFQCSNAPPRLARSLPLVNNERSLRCGSLSCAASLEPQMKTTTTTTTAAAAARARARARTTSRTGGEKVRDFVVRPYDFRVRARTGLPFRGSFVFWLFRCFVAVRLTNRVDAFPPISTKVAGHRPSRTDIGCTALASQQPRRPWALTYLSSLQAPSLNTLGVYVRPRRWPGWCPRERETTTDRR